MWELQADSTIKEGFIVAADGKSYRTKHYNLEMLIQRNRKSAQNLTSFRYETSDALANIDDDDKLKLTKDELDTLTSSEGIKCSVDSRVQSLNLVSESGLYDLIMQSRKPEAKAFKRWVTHEVLTSIRPVRLQEVIAQSEISDYAIPG